MSRSGWRSGVTVSLVPEARGGPFVFWDSLGRACQDAQELGFDTIEIFAPDAESVPANDLSTWLDDCQLEAAAFGTGAGWLLHRLTLTDESPVVRQKALEFAERMVHCAGQFAAPVIIGSLQGRWGGSVTRPQAIEWLVAGLDRLQTAAREHGVPVLFEPLNRYESNLCSTLGEAVELLDANQLPNVRLLADLFHMNIEETDLAQAIIGAGKRLAHLHFVDSNRRAAGWGHLDYGPIVAALDSIQFVGVLSAEALPLPDPMSAARQTIAHYRRLRGSIEHLTLC